MKRKTNRKIVEADVVVIGAGGAGLAAAVTAAANGAGTVVLERRRTPGGATVFAEGIVAAESPVQNRLNVDCSKDDLFKIHMHYSHWTLNARLVRELINISGETVRWLEQKGLKFTLPHLYPGQSPLAWHCPERYGHAVINALMDEAERLGVAIMMRSRADALITDKIGAVIGVAAKQGKERMEIKAKSVVIATGGYGGSKELLKKYCPGYHVDDHSVALLKTMHSGDGIRMAFSVGAADEGLGNRLMHGPVYEGKMSPTSISLFALLIEPATIWINSDGERFMEESASLNPFEAANGVYRQPGQLCYSIFDEAFKKHVIKNGFVRPFESGGYPPDTGRIDTGLEEGVKTGSIKVSGNWDEIAQWMGTDPKILRNTIDEYNADSDQAYDHLFNKNNKYLQPLRTPPYYAALCRPRHLVTIGGIRINHHMEVLDKDYKPIKGLYAAGNDTGGWSAQTYNARLPGTGCGFSVYGGRIAGASAAEYAAGIKDE